MVGHLSNQDGGGGKPSELKTLTNQFFYFHGIHRGEKFHVLNGKMMLTSEKEQDGGEFDKLSLFGYVINEPTPQRFSGFVQELNPKLSRKFYFATVANANPVLESLPDTDKIAFITRRNNRIGVSKQENLNGIWKHEVGGHAIYTCDTLNQVRTVGERLARFRQVVPVFGLKAIGLVDVMGLMINGHVAHRPADPDITLNPSPYMRAHLAFPHLVPAVPKEPPLRFGR